MKSLQTIYRKLVGDFMPPEDGPTELLEPVSADWPCGPSLEYENEFAVLQTRLNPRPEVQYGDFSSRSESPDWTEIERECKRLLLRSKDISILIWYTRCRARTAGAMGLAQGLSALYVVLKKFTGDVHPQLMLDGVYDPAVRANALAALCDPDGLLSDIREIVVSSNTVARLTVRDVERATSIPRSMQAMDPEMVKRQLSDLYARGGASLQMLLGSGACVQEITDWAQTNMGDDAPSLAPLQALLATMTSFAQASGPSQSSTPEWQDSNPLIVLEQIEIRQSEVVSGSFIDTAARLTADMHVPLSKPEGSAMNLEQQREQIRQLIAQVRSWVEQNEPSSPVAVLLKQAERLWGKRFSEVAHAIPADLLKSWDDGPI